MIRELIEHEIGSDSEKFAEWAFGKYFKKINIKYDAWKYWNELHSEKLLLKCDGYPGKDIPKMIQIWKENDKNND